MDDPRVMVLCMVTRPDNCNETVVVTKKENGVVWFSKEEVQIRPTMKILHFIVNMDIDLVTFAKTHGLKSMVYKGSDITLGQTCATLGIKPTEYVECIKKRK